MGPCCCRVTHQWQCRCIAAEVQLVGREALECARPRPPTLLVAHHLRRNARAVRRSTMWPNYMPELRLASRR